MRYRPALQVWLRRRCESPAAFLSTHLTLRRRGTECTCPPIRRRSDPPEFVGNPPLLGRRLRAGNSKPKDQHPLVLQCSSPLRCQRIQLRGNSSAFAWRACVAQGFSTFTSAVPKPSINSHDFGLRFAAGGGPTPASRCRLDCPKLGRFAAESIINNCIDRGQAWSVPGSILRSKAWRHRIHPHWLLATPIYECVGMTREQ